MKDTFGREIKYLRLSVTDRCNLRCRYCMPAEGVAIRRHEDMLTEEELLLVVKAAARLGINKVRITGGEPLVKRNILSICEKTAATPGIDEVCLTTNGLALSALAESLRKAGVRRLNISLDTLNAEKYAAMTRCGELKNALRGLDAALAAGFEKIKINAVLMGGFNDDEIPALAALTVEYPVDVRFIELMPMGADALPEYRSIPSDTVLTALPQLEEQPTQGVARRYRLPGAQGCVGLISPVTRPFCEGCDRLRLTADGRLKPCLHSPQEFPVKGLDEQGMLEQLRRAILAKPQGHGGLSQGNISRAGRTMNRIGG